MTQLLPYIGFTCAYTPLPLIQAAGFVPYRVLPITRAQEQAGTLIHDNMCPHVKRILDRLLTKELPELSGVVLMESCDAMRRLADAWKTAQPEQRIATIDLPIAADNTSVSYFEDQLIQLKRILETWSGSSILDSDISRSIAEYNRLHRNLTSLSEKVDTERFEDGVELLQELTNYSVTQPIDWTLQKLTEIENRSNRRQNNSRVPIVLIGNVLPDPEAYRLFSSYGVHIVQNEMCTSIRQITKVALSDQKHPILQLAESLLNRPPCARSLPSYRAGQFAEQVIASTKKSGAKGVIAHVMKFCDPYTIRLPMVRQMLRSQGIPLLILEGDCTLRSLGQHRTRIEAFVEMLQEN